MLIACPFCKTQAQISEELEGSKVKCPSCKKTYAALEKVTDRDRTLTPLRIVIAALVVPVVGGLFLYMTKKTAHDDAPQTPATRSAGALAAAPASDPASSEPAAPQTKWDTAALDAVKALFSAAYAFDIERTADALSGPDARERAKRLIQSEDEQAFARWKPGDLRILRQDEVRATVWAPLVSRERSGATSEYEFQLAKDGGRWRVAEWKLARGAGAEGGAAGQAPPGDTKASAAERLKVTVEPRRLEHLASTDAALRERIDGLFARMLDLSLSPTENVRASDELSEIGKPALPVLLNGILETRVVDVESMSQVVLINQTLQRITDHPTVFAPGPDTAKVEELRLKTVKSWFEWWGYSGERFQNRPKLPDPFDVELEKEKKKNSR